jgi:6-phosphogluconolactonase (cycloisomerase 2 family)
VNPTDDLVTVFSVQGPTLPKVQTVYAGDQPLSISVSKNGYAYVLDGSVASTGIFGFKVNQRDGTLLPLTNQTIPLSSPIGVPGVVVFSPDGRSWWSPTRWAVQSTYSQWTRMGMPALRQ